MRGLRALEKIYISIHKFKIRHKIVVSRSPTSLRSRGSKILLHYLEKFGSTISGKLAKLRFTQSIPTSLFSLIFCCVLG
jgi:hypothetical protein